MGVHATVVPRLWRHPQRARKPSALWESLSRARRADEEDAAADDADSGDDAASSSSLSDAESDGGAASPAPGTSLDGGSDLDELPALGRPARGGAGAAAAAGGAPGGPGRPPSGQRQGWWALAPVGGRRAAPAAAAAPGSRKREASGTPGSDQGAPIADEGWCCPEQLRGGNDVRVASVDSDITWLRIPQSENSATDMTAPMCCVAPSLVSSCCAWRSRSPDRSGDVSVSWAVTVRWHGWRGRLCVPAWLVV